jgi:hypothetical protein
MQLRHDLTASTGALRDGLNTLEVSVVNGAGQRVRHAVSFAVDTSLEAQPGVIEVDGELSRFDAPGDDHERTEAEHVALRNAGDRTLDLTGWRVQDRAGHRFVFPAFELLPRSVVRIHTGRGADGDDALHWGRTQAVWNNPGDTVFVIDAGHVLRADYTY